MKSLRHLSGMTFGFMQHKSTQQDEFLVDPALMQQALNEVRK